jgi:hypothetical protein
MFLQALVVLVALDQPDGGVTSEMWEGEWWKCQQPESRSSVEESFSRFARDAKLSEHQKENIIELMEEFAFQELVRLSNGQVDPSDGRLREMCQSIESILSPRQRREFRRFRSRPDFTVISWRLVYFRACERFQATPRVKRYLDELKRRREGVWEL